MTSRDRDDMFQDFKVARNTQQTIVFICERLYEISRVNHRLSEHWTCSGLGFRIHYNCCHVSHEVMIRMVLSISLREV